MIKTTAIAGLAAIAFLGQAAAAAEITVLSAGAIQPGLAAAAAAFEKQTGHAVKITYATAPQIAARAGGGEISDVVIAPPAVLDELAKAGKVGERVTVGRVGAGVSVRAGAPAPDISSAEALKRAVLAADSLRKRPGLSCATWAARRPRRCSPRRGSSRSFSRGDATGGAADVRAPLHGFSEEGLRKRGTL